MASEHDDAFGDVRDRYPALLGVKQVADMLTLNERTVLNMIKDGRLPAYRLPAARRWHLVRDEVIDMLKANRIRDPRHLEPGPASCPSG